MIIKLYQNNSDSIVLNKDIVFVNEKNINVREPLNVHEFDILIDNVDCNYCYIVELKRYYYMNKTHTNKTQSTYHLICDVLMTFKEDINANVATLVRNSNIYNSYLTDDNMPIVAYKGIVTKKFPNELSSENDSIILLTNG